MSSGMYFCPDCNNLLYPKEDRERKQLMFLCRRCDFTTYAGGDELGESGSSSLVEKNCVDRINFNYTSKEDIFVSPELAMDPTLGRTYTWLCSKCQYTEAVFFQLPERIAEDSMSLVFVCARHGCGNWEKQGKDADDVDQGIGGDVSPQEFQFSGRSPKESAPMKKEEIDRDDIFGDNEISVKHDDNLDLFGEGSGDEDADDTFDMGEF